jgi:hypothetical protein
MKILAKILLLVTLFMSSCKKEEWIQNDPGSGGIPPVTTTLIPLKQQNAFAINFSGNWCGPCGSSGIPQTNTLYSQNPTRFNPMKVGVQDPLTHPEGTQMAGLFGVTGIPSYVSGADFLQSSSAWAAAINNTLSTPVANVQAAVALSKTKSGDSILVTTKTQFFQAQSPGNYSLAVFLVENNIPLSQAGQSDPNFKHKWVFRGSATHLPTRPTNGLWGVRLESNVPQGIPQNKTYDNNFAWVKPQTLTPSPNLDNIEVIAVIFEMGQGQLPLRAINSLRK